MDMTQVVPLLHMSASAHSTLEASIYITMMTLDKSKRVFAFKAVDHAYTYLKDFPMSYQNPFHFTKSFVLKLEMISSIL